MEGDPSRGQCYNISHPLSPSGRSQIYSCYFMVPKLWLTVAGPSTIQKAGGRAEDPDFDGDSECDAPCAIHVYCQWRDSKKSPITALNTSESPHMPRFNPVGCNSSYRPPAVFTDQEKAKFGSICRTRKIIIKKYPF